MASEIHVDDIGTQLIMTVKDDGEVVDISGASTLTVVIKKPDGISYTKTGTLLTDGTDGNMYYTSVDGDFNVAGNYKIQGIVVLSNGTFYTSISSFKVFCNL
jgi:hypothetical protein